MKKVIIIFFSIFLILNNLSCNKGNQNRSDSINSEKQSEFTDHEVIEFCRQYYIESSKVHAKSLTIYNTEDLDKYYINHEVEKGSASVDISDIYVISDDFDIVEVKKVSEESDANKNYYIVYFCYDYYGTIAKCNKKIKINRFYVVDIYENKLKIVTDSSLIGLSICKSDIPIALQSLKEGKVIKFR